jgi:hypothetical protein
MQECASQNLFAEDKYLNQFLPLCCRPSGTINQPLHSRRSKRISFHFPTKLLTEVFDVVFLVIG